MEWKLSSDSLTKEFEFDRFRSAVEFLEKLTPICDSLQHHPDVELHSYNKLKFKLKTHDMDKVTEKDYRLAEEINALYER
jgi:4a-hydroxytetrahydrobiopterin dehydratase